MEFPKTGFYNHHNPPGPPRLPMLPTQKKATDFSTQILELWDTFHVIGFGFLIPETINSALKAKTKLVDGQGKDIVVFVILSFFARQAPGVCHGSIHSSLKGHDQCPFQKIRSSEILF